MQIRRRFEGLTQPLLTATVCLFGLTAVASASQPWNRDASQWTEKDAEQVLNGSPWVQGASVVFPEPERERPQAPLPGAAAAGMAGGNAATEGRWAGNGAPIKDNRPPMLSVAIRWDSALPVRLANQKSKDPNAFSVNEEAAAKDFIVSVIGLVPARAYRQRGSSGISTSDDSKDVRNPEGMLEGFMRTSSLAFAGKSIRPNDVKFDAATGEVHFFFPRDESLDRRVKEFRLKTVYGSLTVDKLFRTREMTYRGKLEL